MLENIKKQIKIVSENNEFLKGNLTKNSALSDALEKLKIQNRNKYSDYEMKIADLNNSTTYLNNKIKDTLRKTQELETALHNGMYSKIQVLLLDIACPYSRTKDNIFVILY